MDDQYEDEQSEGIAHQSSIDSTAIEDVKEGNEVCEICLDGEVFDDNEILFCDKCNVAVHQHCYGIKEIPQDSWFCFPCQEGLDPKTLTCELCSYSGGAYKRCTKGGNKWAHPLCASWIPEVYEVSVPGKPSLLNLERLDQKRYKLKCGLCTKKGACVQCAYGRCTQGMHPWCALRSTQCTRRIIKGDEGILLWEIFCKTHANAVGEAPKHRSKAKASKVHDDADGHDDMAYWTNENPYPEEKEHKKETSWKDQKWPSSSMTEVDLVSKTVNQLITELRNQEISKTVVHPNDDPIANQVVSLLEWPGMSEGEAMDLEHFWNYVSSFHVEDHTEMWVETTIDAVKNWKHLTVDDEEEDPKETNEDDLEDLIDDALTALGGEREKSAALNPAKRNLLLSRVHQIAEQLKFPTSQPNSLNSSSSEVPNKATDDVRFENELLLFENNQHDISDSGHIREDQSLNIVFDGESRVGCKFEVAPSYFSESAGIVTGDDNQAPNFENLDEWSIQNIIPRRTSNSSNGSQDTKVLELMELVPINNTQVIHLSDRVLRARSDLSELMVIILKDIHAYKRIVNSILAFTEGIVETTDLLDSTGKFQLNNLEWKEINNKYMNQQIWKKISQSVHKGVNHRGDEVIKSEDEPLPPSWALEVEGRPKAGSPDADDEEEAQEDGLCMCCFDGTSSDNNRIVFCDGCNASMHQVCFGIAEIPEGDYYCDRCKFIEKLALTLDEVDLDPVVAKETVKCCLCNLHHGGIKPTTDGRWVHICCALWSGEAEVMDMKDMSPVNISNLVFQPFPTQREKKRNNYLYSENACIYCHQTFGFLVTCSYCQNEPENDSVLVTCNHMFHPLCAWFAGASIKATITDPSYEARQREGRYPAGIEYQFRCHTHSETENPVNAAESLRLFRNKYRIKEGDLEQVPGKAKKKRKKYNRKKEGTGRKATTTSSAPKELPPDVYGDTICASCMRPVSNDIFGNGYNSQALNEIPPLETALVQKTHSTEDQSSLVPFSEEINVSPSSSSDNVVRAEDATTMGSKIIPAPSPYVSCRNCHLTLHGECWMEYRKSSEISSSFDSSSWLCNVCKESDYETVHCALCPRRGGFFCHTVDGTWAHPYCAKSIPAQAKITAEKRIDIRLISKEGKKQKCAICNRKGGICIQCSCIGCASFFHPLCAARSNKGFVRVRNGMKEAFCQEHIPVGVDFIAGYWLDGQELFRFRLFLDRARIILDTLVRREKLKRTLCKTEAELMQTKISKLLDKAKGRKTKVSSANGGGESDEEDDDEKENEEDGFEIDELEEDDESIDDELFDEFVPLDYLSERLKKKSTPTTVPVELSNGEIADVGLTWYNIVRSQQRKNQSLKKLTKVYFAGIEIKEKNTNLDRKSYLKHQKNYIYTNEDQLRTGTFADRRAEEKFAQEIGPNLIKMMKLNDKEFKFQVTKPDDKTNLELRFDKVKFQRTEIPITVKASTKKQTKSKINSQRNKAGRRSVGKPTRGRRNADSDSLEDDFVDEDSDGHSSPSEEEMDGKIDEDEEYVSEEEEVHVRGRGRPRRGTPKNTTPSRQKRHREEDSEGESEFEEGNEDSDQDLPDKKKPKKAEEKGPMESFLVKIREHENSSFYGEMIKRFPAFDSEIQSSQKNDLLGFDQYLFQINNGSTDLDTKMNLIDWRVYPNNELFRLERWIQDMLECLSAYFLYHSEDIDIHLQLSFADYILQRTPDYTLIYSSEHVPENISGQDELKTPVKQNNKKNRSTTKKSQGKRHKPEILREQDSPKLSPLNNSHRKSSALPSILSYTSRERNLVEENGRYLCDDFNDIPYDLIPDYDDSVRRVMTINIMREKLHHHYYHNFASFAKDFYLMLNNARAVTAPNNITWKDTKLLDKLFQESKGMLETKSWSLLTCSWKPINIQSKLLTVKNENSQTKGRKSIIAESRTTRRRSSVVPVKEENEKTNRNKEKIVHNPNAKIFTCYHCRLQYEIMNWPKEMKLPDALPSIIKEESTAQASEEVQVKMEIETNSPLVKNEPIDSNQIQVESESDGRRRSKRFQSIASPAASLTFEESKEPSALSEPMEIEDPSIEQAEAKSTSLDESASTKGSRTSTPSHTISPKITRSSRRGKAETPSLPTVREEATPEIETVEMGQKGRRQANSISLIAQTEQRCWSWVCTRCLHKEQEKLLSHEIQVWWHDDFCTYTGVLNAYDDASHSHRILYYDNEWEFVYLGQEAFLISYPNNSSHKENKNESKVNLSL